MNENEVLTQAARRVDPAAGAFHDLAGSPEARRALTAILETPEDPAPAERTRSVWSRPSFRVAVAAAAVAGAIVFVGTTGQAPSPERPLWDAELVAVAERAPRLLVGTEGWRVAGAAELESGSGETTFTSDASCPVDALSEGCYSATLSWFPEGELAGYVADRRAGADASWKTKIAGRTAEVFRQDGNAPIGTTFYALWGDGGHGLELRSDVIPARALFEEVTESMYRAGVDAWLEAMPPSVVRPRERDDAIDRILADVPIPSNVDVSALKSDVRVSSESTLRYEVTQAVVCGWVSQWVDGRRTGDEAAMAEAAEALAGSRGWRAFRERSQGTTYVFEVADAMAAGAPVNGDRSLPVGTGYQRHLGCPET